MVLLEEDYSHWIPKKFTYISYTGGYYTNNIAHMVLFTSYIHT